MKKVFLTFAVVAAVALVSCNNKAKEEAAETPADSVETLVVEETETVVVDSTAAPADSAAATTATADSAAVAK